MAMLAYVVQCYYNVEMKITLRASLDAVTSAHRRAKVPGPVDPEILARNLA